MRHNPLLEWENSANVNEQPDKIRTEIQHRIRQRIEEDLKAWKGGPGSGSPPLPRPVNWLLTGPWGSGKSTLLDALCVRKTGRWQSPDFEDTLRAYPKTVQRPKWNSRCLS